jgi:hypothetical protein
MKTYQALAILLTLRQRSGVDKQAIARITKELLDMFGPIASYGADEVRQGGYAVNYDGSTKPSRKVSVGFYAPPVNDRHLCFTEPDGLLHGYIDIIPDLVKGCTYRIVGCGSRELNQVANVQAAKTLKQDVSDELAQTIQALAATVEDEA